MPVRQTSAPTIDRQANPHCAADFVSVARSVEFSVLLVVFVIAILLGFVSHAPGSLGVIEATMLVGLPAFPKEELLASLLMFRFLYFIVPLSFAAVLLGLRELRLIAGSAATLGEREPPPLQKRASADCNRTR
jgi:hypothetical protein